MNQKVLKTLIWLKTAATNIWRLLLGILFILIGVALLSLVIIAATGFYVATIHKRKQNAGEMLRSNGAFYKYVAIGIDILGNIIGASFFNWLLLKKPSQFPFGVPGDKISSVLQWNFMIDNLSEWGLNLKHDLDTLEFEHCEKSLLQDLFNARHTIDRYREIQTRMDTIKNTQEFLAKYN